MKTPGREFCLRAQRRPLHRSTVNLALRNFCEKAKLTVTSMHPIPCADTVKQDLIPTTKPGACAPGLCLLSRGACPGGLGAAMRESGVETA
jgi:hypothetical protein